MKWLLSILAVSLILHSPNSRAQESVAELKASLLKARATEAKANKDLASLFAEETKKIGPLRNMVGTFHPQWRIRAGIEGDSVPVLEAFKHFDSYFRSQAIEFMEKQKGFAKTSKQYKDLQNLAEGNVTLLERAHAVHKSLNGTITSSAFQELEAKIVALRKAREKNQELIYKYEANIKKKEAEEAVAKTVSGGMAKVRDTGTAPTVPSKSDAAKVTVTTGRAQIKPADGTATKTAPRVLEEATGSR